jgi:hypothetical protein
LVAELPEFTSVDVVYFYSGQEGADESQTTPVGSPDRRVERNIIVEKRTLLASLHVKEPDSSGLWVQVWRTSPDVAPLVGDLPAVGCPSRADAGRLRAGQQEPLVRTVTSQDPEVRASIGTQPAVDDGLTLRMHGIIPHTMGVLGELSRWGAVKTGGIELALVAFRGRAA